MLDWQQWGPEFKPQDPWKIARHGSMLLQCTCRGAGDRWIPEPAGELQASERFCLQKTSQPASWVKTVEAVLSCSQIPMCTGTPQNMGAHTHTQLKNKVFLCISLTRLILNIGHLGNEMKQKLIVIWEIELQKGFYLQKQKITTVKKFENHGKTRQAF